MASPFDAIRRTLNQGARTASRAARKQASRGGHPTRGGSSRPAPQRRAPAARGNGLQPWSGLLLESVNQVLQPNGDIMHEVKPMEDPKKKPKPRMGADGKPIEPMDYIEGARPGSLSIEDIMGGTGAPLPMSGRDTHRTAERLKEAKRDEKLRDRATASRARSTRADVLGLEDDTPAALKANDVDEMTNALTPEQYNKMTPRQRAAVDFNTLLANAVENDLSKQGKYGESITDPQRKKYDEIVESMFGKDRGSDLYAPETVAVLRNVFDASGGADNLRSNMDSLADLDDFLGLKVAITEDDLGALAKGTEANVGRGSILSRQNMGRSDIVNDIADQAYKMQTVLAKGGDLLQTFSATAQRNLMGEVEQYGGTPTAPKAAPGYGTGEVDALFDQYFTYLADADPSAPKPADFIADLESQVGAEGIKEFFNYADNRSRTALEFGQDLAKVQGHEYRTAEDFRRRLGLEG